MGSIAEAGESDPERRRLRRGRLGAPDADRAHVRARLGDEHRDELARAGDQDLARAAQLQRQRGVEHVGRRQP